MFSKAPVALRCTLMSFARASRVNGPNALDLAILFLFSSKIKQDRKGLKTMSCEVGDTSHSVTLYLHIWTHH